MLWPFSSWYVNPIASEYFVPNSKLFPSSTELYSFISSRHSPCNLSINVSLSSKSRTSLLIPTFFSSLYKIISSPNFVIAWNSSETLPPIVPPSLTTGMILIPILLKIFIYTSCIFSKFLCISSCVLSNEYASIITNVRGLNKYPLALISFLNFSPIW